MQQLSLSVSASDQHSISPYVTMHMDRVHRRKQFSSCDACRKSRVACDALRRRSASGESNVVPCSRCAARNRHCSFEVRIVTSSMVDCIFEQISLTGDVGMFVVDEKGRFQGRWVQSFIRALESAALPAAVLREERRGRISSVSAFQRSRRRFTSDWVNFN